jgi:ribulose-5-phosphate 4-epimerase/fuculose-1-phosphate aldolase
MTETSTAPLRTTPPKGLDGPAAQPSSTAPHEPKVNSQTASAQMMKFPAPPTFTDKHEERTYLKGRLALAFRIFGKLGYDEGVAGHITLRDPVDPTTFWVNPFGLAFSMIKSSDLIQVNAKGEVIDGGENRLLNTAAYMIHHAVHEARPDVLCAAHSHSIHGRAFCALGRELDTITQDSCAFHNDHVVYRQFNGVVLAEEEGKNIAACLGNKKAALLQNHGLLTVGHTVEAAVFWFVSLEKSCQAQLMADAAAAGRGGETVKIEEEDARFTYKTVGSPRAGWFSAKPAFDVMAKEVGDEYLQ